MDEQKNAFFGDDGFFFADWLPVEVGGICFGKYEVEVCKGSKQRSFKLIKKSQSKC